MKAAVEGWTDGSELLSVREFLNGRFLDEDTRSIQETGIVEARASANTPCHPQQATRVPFRVEGRLTGIEAQLDTVSITFQAQEC